MVAVASPALGAFVSPVGFVAGSGQEGGGAPATEKEGVKG